jgi:hypothetical protein
LTRLATSLDALGTGSVDLPERQRTLRATVEWSVDLLDEDERDLLETTAVFVDGWTISAAAAVADLDPERTLDPHRGARPPEPDQPRHPRSRPAAVDAQHDLRFPC